VAGIPRDTPRQGFPALDPEPPPPPWWRRLIRPAAVLVAAALVVAVIRLVPWPGATSRPAAGRAAAGPAGPPVRAGGHIVAVSPEGQLVTAAPDGRHVMRFTGFGRVGDSVAAAPDLRYLALLNGQLISIRPGPALVGIPAQIPLSSSDTVALPDPFADHDQAVATVLDYGDPSASAQNPVSVIQAATGQTAPLGTGDQVAGDPQALGVFVSVAAPPRPSAAVVPLTADAAVELRDTGRPAVTLATAAALNRAAGLGAGLPVALAPFPSPSGAKVAVAIRPASGGPVTGVVVLSRTGRRLAQLNLARPGQAAIPGSLRWSPSGRSLAWLVAGARPALTVWPAGGQTVRISLPGKGSYGTCVWSPGGGSVLCPLTGGRAVTWVVAPATGGRPAVARGAGVPVAWLP
jgi:hypothetical protein